MRLDESLISKYIIESFKEKLISCLNLDVALVGAGPSNMIAGYYLGRAGIKAAIFEAKLSPGGGMWGGGMMFNEIVVQEEAISVVEEIGISYKKRDGYYVMDSIEATSTLISKCVKAGTPIFNLIKVVDVLFREKEKKPAVAGIVINWSPVERLELHVDPIGIQARFVVDGTGHPAEICHIVKRKLGVRLNTETGDLIGEMPLWAEKGEEFTVQNTGEVYPGLYVTGMAVNNVFGGPRMGPIFGGMLRSGKRLAEILIERIRNEGKA